MPTGLASTWRDLDPSTTISASDPEVQPFAPPAAPEPPGEATLLPARFLLQSGNVTLATMPLVAGSRRVASDSGTPGVGVRLEVYVVSWILTSGSIRGAGDFGSRVALAWRRADLAVDHFSTPPSQPTLVKRLPPQQKMESLVGYEIRAARLLDPHLRYRKQKVYIR